MTRAELNETLRAMQASTALGRLNISELHTAFDWAIGNKYLPPLTDDEPHPFEAEQPVESQA